jgi:hypothetical protein
MNIFDLARLILTTPFVLVGSGCVAIMDIASLVPSTAGTLRQVHYLMSSYCVRNYSKHPAMSYYQTEIRNAKRRDD